MSAVVGAGEARVEERLRAWRTTLKGLWHYPPTASRAPSRPATEAPRSLLELARQHSLARQTRASRKERLADLQDLFPLIDCQLAQNVEDLSNLQSLLGTPSHSAHSGDSAHRLIRQPAPSKCSKSNADAGAGAHDVAAHGVHAGTARRFFDAQWHWRQDVPAADAQAHHLLPPTKTRRRPRGGAPPTTLSHLHPSGSADGRAHALLDTPLHARSAASASRKGTRAVKRLVRPPPWADCYWDSYGALLQPSDAPCGIARCEATVAVPPDIARQDMVREDIVRQNVVREDVVGQDVVCQDLVRQEDLQASHAHKDTAAHTVRQDPQCTSHRQRDTARAALHTAAPHDALVPVAITVREALSRASRSRGRSAPYETKPPCAPAFRANSRNSALPGDSGRAASPKLRVLSATCATLNSQGSLSRLGPGQVSFDPSILCPQLQAVSPRASQVGHLAFQWPGAHEYATRGGGGGKSIDNQQQAGRARRVAPLVRYDAGARAGGDTRAACGDESRAPSVAPWQ